VEKRKRKKKKMKIKKRKVIIVLMRMVMNYLTRTWERDVMKGNTNSNNCAEINT
jgi:hypothetical protein